MTASKPAVLGFVIERMAQKLGDGLISGISLIDKPEDGHSVPVIRLTAHEAAMSNTEPAGSYQRGYDEGRNHGTRHRIAEIQQLEASRAADKARIAELEEIISELIAGTGTSPGAARKYGRARAALAQQGKESECTPQN